MKPSIRRTLTLSVISTMLVAIIINSLLSHLIARHEVDEVFDAELLTIARIIRGVIDTPALEKEAYAIGHALEETLKNDDIAPPELADYEKKILIQVWKKDGSQMLFHSSEAPEFAIAPMAPGFYYHDSHAQSSTEGEWITYVAPLQNSDNWLMVGEIPRARNELSLDLIGIFIMSGALALVFCSLLVISAINKGLQPLHTLRRLLRNRSIQNLDAIALPSEPRELSPVVNSMNQLFERLHQGIRKEQQFVADAAHELRTPLAVMKLRTQHLQQRAGPEIQAELQQLSESVSRSHQVVEQLLQLARLDREPQQQAFEPIDIVELTRRVIAELWPKAEQRKIALELESDHEECLRALNPTLLDIALHNLLANAIRYSPADTTVTLSINTVNGLSIEVADEGHGVSEEQLARLTEPFFRAHGQDIPGAGLGLAIVSRICEQLGATLTIRNRTVDLTGCLAEDRAGGLSVTLSWPTVS